MPDYDSRWEEAARERHKELNPPEDGGEILDEFGADVLMDSVIPTRCPQGCEVEPDGTCPHGFNSVLLNAGLI